MRDKNKMWGFVSAICFIIFLVWFLLLLSGCTLNLQNISSNGKSTDLVDDNQAATADVKPTLTLPIQPIGKV